MRLCFDCGGAFDDKPYWSQKELAKRKADVIRRSGVRNPPIGVETELLSNMNRTVLAERMNPRSPGVVRVDHG